MLKQRLLPYLSLIALLLAACAPEATPTNLPVVEPPTAAAVSTATQAPAEGSTALPVATSRGPNLEATDPTTVSLASGGLHFVEFFRFT